MALNRTEGFLAEIDFTMHWINVQLMQDSRKYLCSPELGPNEKKAHMGRVMVS